MNYKDEMRKLIDIIINQSKKAPIHSTMNDMQLLSKAVTDLNAGLLIKLKKGAENKIKQSKQNVVKKAKRKFKPIKVPTPQPLPKPQLAPTTKTDTTTTTQTPIAPTTQAPKIKSVTKIGTQQKNYNKAKTNFQKSQRT